MTTTQPKQQTIIRAPRDKDNPYFAYRRPTAQDDRLSFEARGVLAYLLSKPGDWEIRVPDLMRAGHCGRDRVLRMLKELEEAGYLFRQEQTQDHAGKFMAVSLSIREVPCTPFQCTVTRTPSTEKPSTGYPLTENPQQQNKDTTEPTEVQKKEDAPTGAPAKPVQPHIAIIDAWYDGMPAPPISRKYPRHVKTAQRILKAGYTPAQVLACTRAKYAASPTPDKQIRLEWIEDDLPLWVKAGQNGHQQHSNGNAASRRAGQSPAHGGRGTGRDPGSYPPAPAVRRDPPTINPRAIAEAARQREQQERERDRAGHEADVSHV